MKIRNIILSAITICSLTVAPAFSRPPVTAISADSTPVDDAIVMMKPVNMGKGHIISGFLGKMLNLPKTVRRVATHCDADTKYAFASAAKPQYPPFCARP